MTPDSPTAQSGPSAGTDHFLRCIHQRKLKEQSLSVETLRTLFTYDEKTGWLSWTPESGRRRLGRAGAVVGKGYRSITIGNVHYREHRLVWAYVHGQWPDDLIDHINGIRDDNRIANLRQVTQATNPQNAEALPNKSGYPGVYKDGRKYYFRVSIDGKQRHSTSFETPELAHEAYLATKRKVHPLCGELRNSPSTTANGCTA